MNLKIVENDHNYEEDDFKYRGAHFVEHWWKAKSWYQHVTCLISPTPPNKPYKVAATTTITPVYRWAYWALDVENNLLKTT